VNIYLMTDLEAVAGVRDSLDWCYPTGRYYDTAKELLTLETNAAVEGFLAAGANRVVVCDGHGWGGLMPEKLHPRAEWVSGPYPHLVYPEGLGMDRSFDVMAWVGQHAMAGAPGGHLTHTGSFGVLEMTLNGVPIGEMARCAYMGAELGIRSIFLSGDRAGCEEAQALVPGIETVSVKEGLSFYQGLDLTAEDAEKAFTAARHLSPQVARERIRERAERALRRAQEDPAMGRLECPSAPYTLKTVFRRDKAGRPGPVYINTHPDSFIGLLNAKGERQSAEESDEK